MLNTPFDFKKPTRIGERINELKYDGGYDHYFVLDKRKEELVLAAELYDERSGRLLKVFTDCPGILLYTANLWDGSLKDAMGNTLGKHGAVAVETQAFPDDPNHANFPGVNLNPGETYHTKTVFRFSVN